MSYNVSNYTTRHCFIWLDYKGIPGHISWIYTQRGRQIGSSPMSSSLITNFISMNILLWQITYLFVQKWMHSWRFILMIRNDFCCIRFTLLKRFIKKRSWWYNVASILNSCWLARGIAVSIRHFRFWRFSIIFF